MGEKIETLDGYSQKLMNSGHMVATIRSILIIGIKGYKRRVSRCLAGKIPLHRSAGQSADKRTRGAQDKIMMRWVMMRHTPTLTPTPTKDQLEMVHGRTGAASS